MSVFTPSSTALITGGASGIGLAVARLCLAHGMHVTITDINPETLDLAQKELSGQGKGEIKCVKADVSKVEDWEKLKETVGDKGKGVDFLMLNAGIGRRGTWGERSPFEETLNTNLYGVINGLNTFVPLFQARSSSSSSSSKPAAIVVTGSKQGITNPPGNPAYNASKAAVKALTEHLSWDLRDSNVGVHLLVPGWTFTGLSGNVPGTSKPKPDGAWSPEQVADYMYKKMLDNKFYIICPDNDVTEETDKKRMLWTVGDIVYERPPLTRWREEFKGEAEEWMKNAKV